MHTFPGESIKAADLASGDAVAIFLGGSATAADVRLVGRILDARPKAIRVQLEAARGAPRSLWLPRRALTHLVRDRQTVQSTMARWWRPDERQAGIVDACSEIA